MALAERAELVARLSLKDDFTKGVKGVQTSLGGLERRFGTLGAKASQGISSAVGNIAKIGAVGASLIGVAVKTGLQDLAALENATTSVDGAIKQMGLTGQITSAQVAGWANDIEKNIGAAFDDKEITQAATTLLRFGKTTPANLKPALTVIADLATKTGSVDSAASLLAKALAAPEKAAGRLARTGVILTKAQQAQITAFVKAGEVGKAQALILDAVGKATNGAALASQGPYKRAMSTLADVSEDARKALAEGFLPVLKSVAGKLSTFLADPVNIQKIRDFGKTLAGGLDSLISIGGKLPWAQIGDSFKLAGEGAKTVLGVFTSMPPWVQTAILTGWGLNKLTGGALGGIVGELGKNLIKGVLGMNAAVVNINAGVVNGAGGVGGVGGAAGGVGGVVGGGIGVGGVLASAAILTTVLAAVQDNVITPRLQEQAGKNVTGTQGVIATGNASLIASALSGVQSSVASLSGIQKVLYDLNANGVKTHTEGLEAALAGALQDALRSTERNLQPLPDKITQKQRQQFDALRDKIEASRIATVSRLGEVKQQTATSGRGIEGAIRGIDVKPIVRTSVNVRVSTYVSATSVRRAVGVTSTYSAGHTGALLGQ